MSDTQKNTACGAAVGIAAALASSKINKPSKSGRVNYRKLETDAKLIAETFLGGSLPECEEAMNSYIASMRESAFDENTTLGEVAHAIEEHIVAAKPEQDSSAVADADKAGIVDNDKAEDKTSADIISLAHLENKMNEVCASIDNWASMDYEHKRMVSLRPVPEYADALAEARASAIASGFLNAAGTDIAEEYIDRIKAETVAARKQREQEAGGTDEEVVEEEETPVAIEVIDNIDEEDFVDTHDTSGFDILVSTEENYAYQQTQALPIIDVADELCDEHEAEEVVEETTDAVEGDAELGETITEEEIALDIVEPDIVDDPTAPIVLDPYAIVEVVVEQAEVADVEYVPEEVIEEIVEEMTEAAELDVAECKSFTDQFMVIEVGEDGHAHPIGEKLDNEDVEEVFDEEGKEVLDDERVPEDILTEEEMPEEEVQEAEEDIEEAILASAARTRAALKKAIAEKK